MDSMTLTGFDIAVLVILLLSTLIAFFRGFVREVLSLASWIGAAIVTTLFHETAAEWLEPYISNPTGAKVAAVIGVFLITLTLFSILSIIIVKFVKSSGELGALDSSLGLVFGGLRGIFIISLSYLVLSMVIDEENPPEWLKDAATRPYAKQGAEALVAIAPGYLEDISSLTEEAAKKAEESAGEGMSAAQEKFLDNMMEVPVEEK